MFGSVARFTCPVGQIFATGAEEIETQCMPGKYTIVISSFFHWEKSNVEYCAIRLCRRQVVQPLHPSLPGGLLRPRASGIRSIFFRTIKKTLPISRTKNTLFVILRSTTASPWPPPTSATAGRPPTSATPASGSPPGSPSRPSRAPPTERGATCPCAKVEICEIERKLALTPNPRTVEKKWCFHIHSGQSARKNSSADFFFLS